MKKASVKSLKKLELRNDPNFKRAYRKSMLLNFYEMQAINKYCKKYKIENKSRFMRETIISEILKKMTDDYPTLWEQPGVVYQLKLAL